MKRRKKPIWLLVLGSLSLVFLIYTSIAFPPDFGFRISDFGFPILPFFFILTFAFLFFLFSFLLGNFRRGLFIGLFVSIYLLLRFLALTHIFFPIMLLILFITLEMFFNYKK
ncbi:MAG: hypothetical protein A2860_01055 [Candidatus Levybacteria bacterium RIFCSPHIGHO2_01_FULL_37_33]|nr:MAG: hypothetical protein A2860_01055 [Candidatus Levybacteria bacterium RIFCSPHIGHO2_01_FULL_37_33]OGH32525.1 MAG: hypothetical protein A2953_02610 [Candidatus Levybacteria bacterium RIFCSPLOWO2_01_FULL_36_54]